MTDSDGVREAVMLYITSGLEEALGDVDAELAAIASASDVIWTAAMYQEATVVEASIIGCLLKLCGTVMDIDPREVWRAVALEELSHRPST